MTSKQKEVLELFLQNKSDDEIASKLGGTSSNIRKHLANSCNTFGLRDFEGDRCRDDLVHLFIDFKPEWVCLELQTRFRFHPPLEIPEGSVPLNSKFYVERSPVESVACKEMTQPGALIRVKAPGQMGKSSLINRIKAYAAQKGYAAITVNLGSASTSNFSDLDQFLYWFCSTITDELEREDGLDTYWKAATGTSNRKCEKYLKRSLLRELEVPLVLCLDNVDRIFQYRAIATDFFGLLRSWHEQAKTDEIWARLRIVLSYTKEVYVPLDINRSPFNVGVQIDLSPFNLAQVTDLVQRHGLRWSEIELQRLQSLLGGHPYLVRVALYQIAQRNITLADLLSSAPTEGGIYGEYLKDLLLNVQESPVLAEAVRRIIASPESTRIETETAFKLTSLGVARYVGNEVQMLCELYRQYLRERLEKA
ncbi:adenylate cyclase [Leptolyngbya sp. NK1-12]|uniref:Adenylate cyclase n=1 Tax=Leptolyngbya sp. NK1-12 TaxID=2547451 RepID=A0AA97AJ88_9CYAN|nr:adenylate cyclase [Leptolyngbya sp. NK1-12]